MVSHYHDSSAARGGGLHRCPAVHGDCAGISAADYCNDSFLRHDLRVVATERTQDEFRAGIDREDRGWGAAGKAAVSPPPPKLAAANRPHKNGSQRNFPIQSLPTHPARPAAAI